jgi:hypothetical protein
MIGSFPRVIPPHPVEGCDNRLLPYWAAIKQWRERDNTWPTTVYWHLFARQIEVSEAVLDKCYRHFISMG